jgi:subtilisin family serine protease
VDRPGDVEVAPERTGSVDPRLDVLLDASTAVNTNRAEQCGSLALSVPDPGAAVPTSGLATTAQACAEEAPSVVRLTADQAVDAREAADDPAGVPELDFSVFLQLRPDLDAAALAVLEEALRSSAKRFRINGSSAVAEIPGTEVATLDALPSVAYVELGERLSVPQPTPGTPGTARTAAAGDRRVRAETRHHRDGAGVLVGLIDVGGFDFAHPDFLDAKGRTRWVSIWDQGGTTRPPPSGRGGAFADLDYGSEITAAHMADALAAQPKRGTSATLLEPQSSMRRGSHGTHVASIAAGNKGVARQAHLAGVLVALEPDGDGASFYDSTRLADAVDHLLALAAELSDGEDPLPVSINISLGTNGHAHDASSALARWVDHALTSPGRCVCVAAGNAGQTEPAWPGDRGHLLGRVHASGTFAATSLRHDLGWLVGDEGIADVSDNEMEIWYSPQDRIAAEVRTPDGTWIGPIEPNRKLLNHPLADGTFISIHNRLYLPSNGANCITIQLSPFFGPVRDGMREVGPLASGRWTVRLTGRVVRDGRFDAWIGRDDPRRAGTGPAPDQWLYPSTFAPGSYTDDRMIGSLACADRVLAVANADLGRDSVHVSSSRGPTREGRPKPDIAADGTDVVAAGGFDRSRPWMPLTGTSMASPYVCGVAALMLAIDPRLTATQIQGMVKTTSIPFPGHPFTWRSDSGFGVIDAEECVRHAVACCEGEREVRL